MARIEVVLHSIRSTGVVSILIDIEEATQCGEFSTLALGSVNPAKAIETSRPYLTGLAIEAACISGALYARRVLEKPGFSVRILHFEVRGDVENAEPFARAVAVAACRACGKDPNSILVASDWTVGGN